MIRSEIHWIAHWLAEEPPNQELLRACFVTHFTSDVSGRETPGKRHGPLIVFTSPSTPRNARFPVVIEWRNASRKD
jgi:hypothetical protein